MRKRGKDGKTVEGTGGCEKFSEMQSRSWPKEKEKDPPEREGRSEV